jgi:hypothetical protein
VLVVERPPGDDGGEDGGQDEVRPQHHEYIYTVHEHRQGGALPLADPVEELQEPRDAGKDGLQGGHVPGVRGLEESSRERNCPIRKLLTARGRSDNPRC